MFAWTRRLLAGLALLPVIAGTALAQSPAGDCEDAAYLASCPSQCATTCEDPAFFRAHVEECAAAFEADPAAEPASCGPAEPQAPVTLGACIERASAIAVEDSPLPDLRDIYTAFYSDLPTCAKSPVALTEMYACLNQEAEIITSEFGSIQRIDVDSSAPAAMLAAACRLKQLGTIAELHGSAKSLSGRAQVLTTQLSSVSDCRRSYSDWLGERGKICSDAATTFEGCEIAISALNLSIDQRLTTASQQNDRIVGVLEALKQDLSTIIALTIIAGGIPTGENCQ